MRNAWLLLLITLGSAAPALGKDCKGVSFPDSVPADGARLTLNGLGLREATFLKVDVYVAALYLAAPSTDPKAIVESSQPKRLILHFLRDVEREDISKAWQEGFQAASPSLQARVATLNGWMADMKTADRLTFTHLPGKGVQVEVAGANKGIIPGEDFAKALFAIWLGAKPPNPGLKTGLLGGNCG